MRKPIVLASLVLAFAAAPALADPAAPAAPPVKDFDVFVDPPTGFVFVKLPQGWKFAGKVDDASLDHLPPTVLTWLLPPEGDETLRMAEAKRAAK